MLTFEPERVGEFIDCPNCGMDTELYAPPPQQPQPPPHPAPAPETPAQYVERVRKTSAYMAVRVVIGLVALLVGGIGIVFIHAGLITPMPMEGRLVSISSGLLVIVAAIIFRQIAFVAFDVADMMAEQNRRR